MQSVSDIRREYVLKSLSEKDVANNPFKQFAEWWNEAIKAKIDEVNAATLATASNDGLPSARIVLLKRFDERGFVFYTNYNSFKGEQLAENPRACLVFFWKELERQVRILGLVEKTSSAESDEYFNSRPYESRVGAVSSPQSDVIENREWLEKRFIETKQLYGEHIKRPEHWGGYRLMPAIVEFWQGRQSRLHDRIQYSFEEGRWKIERLAP